VVYVAFPLDVFNRRTVGWKAGTYDEDAVGADTLDSALWSR
jgi:hypothetical protein